MKTKIVIIIIISTFILYLSYSIFAQGIGMTGNDKGKKNTLQEEESSDTESEDFSIYEDQDFFSRKLFQRELPRLSRRDKISWVFRTAKTNLFL
jgi:hypothetical protein